MEFIVQNQIKAHPMALAHFDRVSDENAREQIERLTRGYEDKTEFFVHTLARGIARIAASQHPDPVIVRMSDFKTNEYAQLVGGSGFEPHEENPMIGWRGASRYHSDGYRDGFLLECRAIKRAREHLGLDNLVAGGKKIGLEVHDSSACQLVVFPQRGKAAQLQLSVRSARLQRSSIVPGCLGVALELAGAVQGIAEFPAESGQLGVGRLDLGLKSRHSLPFKLEFAVDQRDAIITFGDLPFEVIDASIERSGLVRENLQALLGLHERRSAGLPFGPADLGSAPAPQKPAKEHANSERQDEREDDLGKDITHAVLFPVGS